MTGGGVADTGRLSGRIITETQPGLTGSTAANAVSLLFIFAAAMTVVALWMIFSEPAYAKTLVRREEAQVILAARWALRVLGATILAGIAADMFAQARRYLGTLRFHSLVVLLDLQGNYGRSRVTVGKAREDAIESENVIVRSDCSVSGAVAAILTESPTFTTDRQIVSMLTDDRARQVEGYVADWLERFARQGTAIASVDVTHQAVEQVVKANVAVTELRAKAKAEAQQRAFAGGTAPTPVLTAVVAPQLEASAAPAAAGAKSCPDCAEEVKAAARKCRFCGYRFDG